MVNLLILSPDYSKRVNWGHQHLRDALLEEVENSIQYGEGCAYRGNTYIPDICEEVSRIEGMGYPNAILMENWKNMRKFSGGSEVDALKAFMVCDYYPDNRGHINYYNSLLKEHGVDLAICPTPNVVDYVEEEKEKGNLPEELKSVWIPHGVNIDIFYDRGLPKEYDVMAVFGLVSYVYPNRPLVQDLIRDLIGVKTLTGDWRTGIKHFEYAEAINKSKIFVCSNGINNQVLMKYYEIMASGTFLLTNLPNDYKQFGFKPGEHFGTWKDLTDLKNKIYYWLEHDEEREKIARQGKEFVREEYSTTVIAKRIREEIEESLPTQSYGEIDENERTPYETGFFGD